MMVLSLSLERRLLRETLRHVGSEARLMQYSGRMPRTCEDAATGEKIGSLRMDEEVVRKTFDGHEPDLAEGAGYWRLLDNGGLVVMQGDGKP
jgi:hypothetical protein